MTERNQGADPAARDFRTLPPRTRLDQMIATITPDGANDPAAGRNADQDRALQAGG
jgi:hypothetical protein